MPQYTKDRRFHYVKRKKPNQRMKHYLAYEYLRRNTDENNTASANTILRCVSSLLDTMVDRFGTKDAIYKKLDNNHFVVTAQMEVSDQFFGWLCGFGKRVKVIFPVEVEEDFGKYVSKILDMYEDVIT